MNLPFGDEYAADRPIRRLIVNTLGIIGSVAAFRAGKTAFIDTFANHLHLSPNDFFAI
jgi:hypothetical protein